MRRRSFVVLIGAILTWSCAPADVQSQDLQLVELSVEMLRKVSPQWDLDLRKAEVQGQKPFPKTKCDAADLADQPPEFVVAKYSLETERIHWSSKAQDARLLELQAEGLALDRMAGSTAPGITPSSFADSSPSSVGVIAEKLVAAELIKANVAHNELFESIVAYETTVEKNCNSDEYTAVSLANEATKNQLLAKAVPLQAENLRALVKRVDLQPLLSARSKFRDQLEAVRKGSPEAITTAAALQERRRKLGGAEFTNAKAEYEAALRALALR